METIIGSSVGSSGEVDETPNKLNVTTAHFHIWRHQEVAAAVLQDVQTGRQPMEAEHLARAQSGQGHGLQQQ